VRQTADADAFSPWSTRETELLEVALQLLEAREYDGLTVDACHPPCQQGHYLPALDHLDGVRPNNRKRPPGRGRNRHRNAVGLSSGLAHGNACAPTSKLCHGYLLPRYVVLRSIIVGWPTTDRTVQILDDIVVPP
jgi:hypothetical protein